MKLNFLPGFKNTFRIVGIAFILLALSLFGRGLIASMADFKVPELVLNSPYYHDALFWTYTHMLVIGVLLICFAYSVTELRHQKWISFILFLATAFYTYLDFRSSDSVLGNGLYKGKASVFPAFISLLFCLLFLQLTLRLLNKNKHYKAKNLPHIPDQS